MRHILTIPDDSGLGLSCDRVLYALLCPRRLGDFSSKACLCETFECLQKRRKTDVGHVWPSSSAGAQQSSLFSYGTAWGVRGAPCSSEATVSVSQQLRGWYSTGARKRPNSGHLHAVSALQVQARHHPMLPAGLLSSAVLRSLHCPI